MAIISLLVIIFLSACSHDEATESFFGSCSDRPHCLSDESDWIPSDLSYYVGLPSESDVDFYEDYYEDYYDFNYDGSVCYEYPVAD